MPAVFRPAALRPAAAVAAALGPDGPFPDVPLGRVRERRWLHYALVSRDHELGVVANIAWLGPSPEDPLRRPRCTAILLVHQRSAGWCASQFNAHTLSPPWSAFRAPNPHGAPGRFEIAAASGRVGLALDLVRSSRPCTSQCAPFADDQHLRWQSETGVLARGDLTFAGRLFPGVAAVGYHERVRGYWGWPELGGWVFGFANDPAGPVDAAPETAVVFTLIQPRDASDAACASVMLWRRGRLVRHFPRRCVTAAVRGALDRDRVQQVPELANLFGVPPMQPIPRRLVIAASMGRDEVVLDFACAGAARIVIPNETGVAPFSVHEVIGPCDVQGHLGNRAFGFRTHGIVEFAGGADAD